MTTIRERAVSEAAKAIRKAGSCGKTVDGELVFCAFCDCPEQAEAAFDAVIQVLMEPSQEMIEASIMQTTVDSAGRPLSWEGQIKMDWQAMLKEAAR